MLPGSGYRAITFFTLALTLACAPALAGMFTLADDNATVAIDTDSQAGMYRWTVDGVDNLSSQWFWYRTGPEGAEQSIDKLALVGELTTDTDGDGADDTLFVQFAGDGFDIQTRYLLSGGTVGSGVADIAELILITNTSDQNLEFHFFQYSDFDLNGTSDDDTVTLASPSRWVQQDGAGSVFSETVVTPTPAHFEAALFPNTLDSLNDDQTTTLSDAAGPLTGNATWAWQWDLSIGPGGSVTISKDKNFVVPEPASLSLLMLGALTTVPRRCRQRRSTA